MAIFSYERDHSTLIFNFTSKCYHDPDLCVGYLAQMLLVPKRKNEPDSSVPYTSSPMMRDNPFFAGRFFLLHGIVQEEVNQDCVYVCFGMLAHNLAPQHFDAPDAASCVARSMKMSVQSIWVCLK